MAKIIVTDIQNMRAIAALAGSDLNQLSYHGNSRELSVPDVTQKALDDAMTEYVANQEEIDADFEEMEAETKIDREEAEFNNTKPLKAMIEFLVEQINELRALQELPPVTFDFRSAIKSLKG